ASRVPACKAARYWLASRRSLWRNRLARSAVNRKVGGSSPPRDEGSFSVPCRQGNHGRRIQHACRVGSSRRRFFGPPVLAFTASSLALG
ncbi:hypothetical protein ABG768_028055, partial [Culter alburnus]